MLLGSNPGPKNTNHFIYCPIELQYKIQANVSSLIQA